MVGVAYFHLSVLRGSPAFGGSDKLVSAPRTIHKLLSTTLLLGNPELPREPIPLAHIPGGSDGRGIVIGREAHDDLPDKYARVASAAKPGQTMLFGNAVYGFGAVNSDRRCAGETAGSLHVHARIAHLRRSEWPTPIGAAEATATECGTAMASMGFIGDPYAG